MNREKLIGWLAATLIRALGWTLRFCVNNRTGLQDSATEHPVIWAFWHNRMLMIPVLQERYFKKRHGAVLSSPSKDGQIIAEVMGRFGLESVRGSSSRRGANWRPSLKRAAMWQSHPTVREGRATNWVRASFCWRKQPARR